MELKEHKNAKKKILLTDLNHLGVTYFSTSATLNQVGRGPLYYDVPVDLC